MKNELGTLEGIVDIEPPAMPMLYDLEISAINISVVGLIIIGVCLIISAIIWQRYLSTKGKSRYQLKKLQKNISVKNINSQSAACEISRILRTNLGLSHILKRENLPEELGAHQSRWDIFTERLSVACFSSYEAEPEIISTLFEDAHFWIKSWPRNSNA